MYKKLNSVYLQRDQNTKMDWWEADILNSENYAGKFREGENVKWSLKRYSEGKSQKPNGKVWQAAQSV